MRGRSQITESWVDCNTCGTRYGAHSSSCPSCGAANVFSKNASSRTGLKVAAGLAIASAAIGILLFTPVISLFLNFGEDQPPLVSILPPIRQEPKTIPQEELVQHALELINADRASFGLTPVKLSSNVAAQVHAEDVFRNKQISHWMSNGEKPYMTYSRYGGTGGMAQNVAIAGFSKDQYEECIRNSLYECEKIDPLTTIQELQYEMMYNDKECCADGHRNNILDEYRTHVSIGIVYDQYYLVFVQNFENNYGLEITTSGQKVMIIGELSSGTIDHLAVYYDPIPTTEAYEANKRLLSYSGGELTAVIVKPLPPGFYYERPNDYRLLVAEEWKEGEGGATEISFDMARAVDADGVYTVSVTAKTAAGETFEAASYSVVVNSQSG